MEVVVPAPEFHFHAAANPPCISVPSSPPNHFAGSSPFFDFSHHRHASAPSSPTSSAAIYAALRKTAAAAARGSRHSSVPFDWEEKPGTPKRPASDEDFDDFEFDFSFGFSGGNADTAAQPLPGTAASFVAADELFELGKIRPLKLPPRLYSPVMGEQAPKSPRNGGFLSPLRRGRNQRGGELDPFALAMVEATRSRRGSRSLSPFRGGDKGGSFLTPASSPPRNPPPTAEKGGRGWKWRLKELLLFRSSSEGQRARGERTRSHFSKYGSSSSSSSSASSNSSVGSAKVKTGFGVSAAAAAAAAGGGCGESSCSSLRSEENGSNRRGAVAPQEMEGTDRTAAAMEKKMVAPYKQRLSIVQSIAAGKFGASFIRRRS